MAEGLLGMENIGSSCAATSTGAPSAVGSPGVVGGELTGAGGGGQLDGKLELHVDGSLLVGEPGGAGAGGAGTGVEDDVLVTEPVLGIRMLMSSRVSRSLILPRVCVYASLSCITVLCSAHTMCAQS